MNRREDQLFEAVRSVPVELSQEQVATIIQALPMLPIPVESIWVKLFTFKHIIMNSVLVSIVAGGILYVSNIDQANTEQIVQIDEPISPIEETAPTSEVPDSFVPSLVYTPEEVPTVSKTQVPLPSEATISPEPELVPLSTEEISEGIPSTAPPLSISPIYSSANLFTFTPTPTPVLASTPTPTLPILADISDYQAPIKVKLLRRRLLSQLKSDRFIRSKKEIVEMFVFPNQLIINEMVVEGKLKRKYLNLLRQHRIHPYPNQQIRISPENIMVGILTGDDFEGIIIGTFDSDEEYPFIDDDGISSAEEDLFLYDTNGSGQLIPVPMEGIQIQGKSILPVPPAGSQELLAFPSEGLGIAGQAIIAAPPSGSQDLFVIPQGSTSIYGQGMLALPPGQGEENLFFSPESSVGIGSGSLYPGIATYPYLSPTLSGTTIEPALAMDGNIWARLKSELLSNLIIDGYISNTQSQVFMTYQEGKITVNRHVLPPNFVQKYTEILQKYPISSGRRSQIHITKDYLMAGDFDDDGSMIKGHIHGKTELDDSGKVQGLQEY